MVKTLDFDLGITGAPEKLDYQYTYYIVEWLIASSFVVDFLYCERRITQKKHQRNDF